MISGMASTILALVLITASGYANAGVMRTVVADGLEWLRPVDIPVSSWSEIDVICDHSTGGNCSGLLNGVDLSGWTWADDIELIDLFVSFGMPRITQQEKNSSWAPTIVNEFGATFTLDDAQGVSGLARPIFACGTTPCVVDYGVKDFSDSESVDTVIFNAGGFSTRGHAWFHRAPVIDVPVPNTPLLFAVACFAYLCGRLKTKAQLPSSSVG